MNENSPAMIRVTLPDGQAISVRAQTTLLELSRQFEKNFKSRIIAAKVNHEVRELSFPLCEDCRVRFIDLAQSEGMRIYRRSLQFVFIKAVHELYPERKVIIGHSISKGLYCSILGEKEPVPYEIALIEQKMREIVNACLPFVKRTLSLDEAKEHFRTNGRIDRFHAIEYRVKTHVTIYSCGDFEDYFYGYMAPDTGYIDRFKLLHYPPGPGVVILSPDKEFPEKIPEFTEQKKLFNIFKEHKQWGHILGIDNIGDLNDIIQQGKILDLMIIAEALQEKKIAQIADMITGSSDKKRLVLISGPSSSGKTTFAHRLEIQLRVNGVRPMVISLDDYFLNREKTPLDENGEYDFEALEAIDIELFNDHLTRLIRGEEVERPVFNFHTGQRETAGKRMKINEEQILVIEGIHGLNEKLTASIPAEKKFKIYVSALTSMNIDDHNRIPTTDGRIVRRIVRDFQFRGNSAVETISRWPSVRRGEEKNIFPYQENADVMFNSSLVYELGVLKTFAEPLLCEVDPSRPEYSEAKRLREFLSYFLPIESKNIAATSILREFVGGSCFY